MTFLGFPGFVSPKDPKEVASVESLVYLHEHGCPWDESTCEKAAEYGMLINLTYAHEHGCPWDESATTAAAGNGRPKCLKYLYENGCHWNERAAMTSLKTRQYYSPKGT